MVTDYDENRIAEQYQQYRAQSWRSHAEAYSFMKLIGDVEGKRVLDVACGEGNFTRMLRKAGAAEVAGIDISERMIDSARVQEARQPLGIDYRVEDAGAMAEHADFDLVVAAWLLVYAQTRAELLQMCRGLASRLRSGGRFVTVVNNPAVYGFDPLPDYRKYGFELSLADHAVEGAPTKVILLLEDSTLEIENYYMPVAAYESALTQAGFRDFAVHMPEVSHTPDDDPAYWDDFLKYPSFILLDCVRP
ncbi:MAG TPA: class I SAM-dependent methyltransferase [Mycobacterium sp.]|uniref:class I SAM-dependent methyltransferase n=1 Tax=Mycobacterium sp. TaxID=1785 RepID=UPI002D225518|nr:class I SAM-dependent methyltransferase [Mycobacterium sp.]HXY66593.1 class I SAM-dependent methyltransferase [Mycobacterium sp.]